MTVLQTCPPSGRTSLVGRINRSISVDRLRKAKQIKKEAAQRMNRVLTAATIAPKTVQDAAIAATTEPFRSVESSLPLSEGQLGLGTTDGNIGG